MAKAWETAFYETPTPRTRKIALRSAMTFSPDPGGVFDVLLSLVRAASAEPSAPASSYVSWIHDADYIRATDFLIAHPEIDGPVNICSPHPLPNRDFQRALRRPGAHASACHHRMDIEIGTRIMRTESELVLKSRRAVPTRLLQSGFEFSFPEWPEAARDLVRPLACPALRFTLETFSPMN